MSEHAEMTNWDTVTVGSEEEGPTLQVYSKAKTFEFFKSAEARKDSAEARDARETLRAELVETE
jgi:hypothetical protein